MLPQFNISEIDEWNKYNEDIQILTYSHNYILDETVEEFLYNKAEGHNIDYHIIYKKVLIEDASHELQTPLVVFQSQLDMLLQESDLGEKHLDVSQSLYSVSSRLTRLNKNLLLLAKLDNAQFKNMEELDFTAVLSTSIAYLKDLAEKSGIKLHVDLKNSLVIHANKILFDSLINNLFSNAIRHNIENGEI